MGSKAKRASGKEGASEGRERRKRFHAEDGYGSIEEEGRKGEVLRWQDAPGSFLFPSKDQTGPEQAF